jgi:hypothetical protein
LRGGVGWVCAVRRVGRAVEVTFWISRGWKRMDWWWRVRRAQGVVMGGASRCVGGVWDSTRWVLGGCLLGGYPGGVSEGREQVEKGASRIVLLRSTNRGVVDGVGG